MKPVATGTVWHIFVYIGALPTAIASDSSDITIIWRETNNYMKYQKRRKPDSDCKCIYLS